MDAPKVFLNHAKEDSAITRQLYDELNKRGVDVWFDEISLKPGQNWRLEISKAIRACNYFILIFSSKSVSKTGYVNAEIVQALDQIKLRPQGEVYIIPVRLDECEVSFSELEDLQRVDLFPKEKYEINLKNIFTALGVDEQEIDYKRSIIIWHTHQDKEYAQKVCSFFRACGFKSNVLNQHNVISEKIQEIISDVAYFVPLLSDSLNHTTAIDDIILEEAIKRNEMRGTNGSFIIPIKMKHFLYEKHEKLGYIFPIESVDENGNDRFKSVVNDLMSSITNHLIYWGFEANSGDLLENATIISNADVEYSFIVRNHKKSKPKLYAMDYLSAALNSFARENYEKALERFYLAANHGLRINELPEILSKIGACYIGMNKFKKAEEVLEHALMLDHIYPPSHYNKGILLKECNRFMEAIQSFKRAIDTLGNDKQNRLFILAWNNMAITFKELYKDTKDERYINYAIRDLEEVVKSDISGSMDYNLACCYCIHPKANKTYYEKALNHIEKAFKSHMDHIFDAIYDIGLSMLRDKYQEQFWQHIYKYSMEYKMLYRTSLDEALKNDDIRSIDRIAENLKKASNLELLSIRALTHISVDS